MAELDGRRGGTSKWSRIRRRILARDGYRCRTCGGAATCVDHRIPRSAGGDDSWQNLQALCDGCHKAKTVRELRTLSQMPRRRRKRAKTGENGRKRAGKAQNRPIPGLSGAGSNPFGGPDEL